MQDVQHNRTNINSSEFFKQQLLQIDQERPDDNLRPAMKHKIIKKN